MTTNYHKQPAKDQKLQENDHKIPVNDHPCTSNQKTDVLFFLPKPCNYKDYPDFEKHRQSVRGDRLLLSQYLRGARKIEYACFCRLGNINFSFDYI